MKRHLDLSKPNGSAAPTCWHREGPSTCLRLEPGGDEIHLLPYQHLVSVTLEYSGSGEKLRLSFSTRDVEIAGRNLREMLSALQDFEVKWIRVVPEKYHALGSTTEAMVSWIKIKILQ